MVSFTMTTGWGKSNLARFCRKFSLSISNFPVFFLVLIVYIKYSASSFDVSLWGIVGIKGTGG